MALPSGLSHGESSLRGQVVGLINDAKLSDTAKDKLRFLKQASEVLIHREPGLAPKFAQAMFEFQVRFCAPSGHCGDGFASRASVT